MSLIAFTERGLYCPKADVYIDPWRPVSKAIITHAHADHSRSGMKSYMGHHHSLPVMRWRLGDITAQGVDYGEKLNINGVEISLHPAGHIPGSAQVRLAYEGHIWVVSGDYKLTDDGLSAPFEPVPCTHFITESTFGLPVYRWPTQVEVMNDINRWWAANRAEGMCSVVLCYALGKAQRILHHLDGSLGPIYVHGAIHHTNRVLEQSGYISTPSAYLDGSVTKSDLRGAMVLAPPSALGSPWMKRLSPYKVATASGWMSLRGARRRRNVDQGFILSDHADWDGLNQAVEATGAENIYVTHGYSEVFSSWLRQKGLNAQPVRTEYEGELAEIGESKTIENEAE